MEEGELLHASSVGDGGDISWENDSMNMNIPLNMGEGVSIIPSGMHIVEEEETYRGDLIPSHDLSLDVDVDDASLKSFLMFQESPALNESPEIRPEDDDQADLPLAKKRRTDVVPEPHISIINPASSLDFMNFAASILEDPQTKQQPQQIPNNNNNTATTATTLIPETTTNSQPLSDKDDYSTEPNVDEEARARYEDKRRRNRESAFKSRKRKNDAIQDLGARVELLEKQLAAAHEENAQLRTLLARAAAAALGGADANTTKSEGAGKSTTCQAPEERQANTTPAVGGADTLPTSLGGIASLRAAPAPAEGAAAVSSSSSFSNNLQQSFLAVFVRFARAATCRGGRLWRVELGSLNF
eukprot:CAMPEP_0205962356 /NCGR_PEP_ID=MMETSP1459-20131121/70550_1 /ASSEMBLY_ACC=CAM_ASM_001120 /TAXON_ID=41880 /ORGANISM="Pycnococcus provasolii, Strain RCC931" /LENGTH=356 /DNA_ID=CAMNT_0053335133 /DNA_START=1571 /DNA_END=2640 /DNA_ORIENTATION=-